MSPEEKASLWLAMPDEISDAEARQIEAAVEDYAKTKVAQALEDLAAQAAPTLGNEIGGHTSTYSVRKWLQSEAKKVRES